MPALLVRSIVSMCGTMFLVSLALFALLEAGSGDVTKKILGAFATPEQRQSYRRQLGLDQPLASCEVSLGLVLASPLLGLG